MSKVTIEVAGSELDLAKGIGFGLNFAIDDVKKIESKNSNYSKTITLAGSKNNSKILGGLFDINADFTFFNPNFKTEAKIIVDSSTVMDGFLQLKSIEKQTDNTQEGNLIVYKCVISSKTVDFMTAIKDKKLNELDFTRFNHVYNYNTISDSWTNTVADVFVYPLLHKNSNHYGTEDFKPAIFHKAYLKRIAQESGYTLSGSLMDETTEEGLHYSKEIIPFNGELTAITEAEAERRLFKAGMAAARATIESGTVAGATFTGYEVSPTTLLVLNDDTTGGNFDNDNHWNTTTNEYTIDKNGSYNISVGLHLSLTHSSSGVDAYQSVYQGVGGTAIARNFDERYQFAAFTQMYVNGSPVGAASRDVFDAPLSNSASPAFGAVNGYTRVQDVTTSLNVPNLNLNDTDVVTVKYFIIDGHNLENAQYSVESSGLSVTDVPITYTVEVLQGAFTKIENSVNSEILSDGDTVVLSNLIPKNAKQSDLIKDLVKRCNAYISVDPNNDRNVIIDTRDSYYAKGGELDWSDKQDYGSKTDIKLLSELQNKEFLFSYKADKDSYNENYTDSTDGDIFGQQTVEFVNEFVEGVKKIETPFSPTPLIYNSGNPVAIVSAIPTAAPKQNIRVLYYGGLINTIDSNAWTFSHWESGAIVVTSLTTYPYAGHLDNPISPTVDINFGENPFAYYSEAATKTNGTLYNRFWANYINQIDEGKLATKLMNLNEVDISFIRNNLNAKIYVNDSWYYINKIIDYNPLAKGLTKVEFLKINEGISFVPEPTINLELKNLVQDNMRSPEPNIVDPTLNTDFSTYSSLIGKYNTIGSGSDYSTVIGENNSIGKDSPNSVIQGNNNSIAEGVENAFIIGSNNRTVTESGTSWIGSIQYRNGAPVDNLPYYIYSALVTQTGTAAPTLIELQNTLETVITPVYAAVGTYTLGSSVALTPNKATAISSIDTLTADRLITRVNTVSDDLILKTWDSTNTLKNGVLTNSFIEIRVYK